MTGVFEAGFAKHRSLVLRSIFALCLLGATFNHWSEIRQHGFLWDHGGFPRASTLFWTALAFLDPMTAVLLFVRPNAGIVATVSIIVADVIHNVWIQASYFPASAARTWAGPSGRRADRVHAFRPCDGSLRLVGDAAAILIAGSAATGRDQSGFCAPIIAVHG